MDKSDLIYNTVLRIEKRFDEELKPIKDDLEDLKAFKNQIVGICMAISIAGSFIIDYIKQLFLGMK